MVAQGQRLTDAAEPERVLGDAGDRQQLVDAAYGQQQPVIGHDTAVSFRIGESDLAAVEVDLIDRARYQPDPGPKARQGHRDTARVEDPARHLRQQRQVEEVVHRADQDDLYLAHRSGTCPPPAVNQPGQGARGVKTREPAADDDNLLRAATTVERVRHDWVSLRTRRVIWPGALASVRPGRDAS